MYLPRSCTTIALVLTAFVASACGPGTTAPDFLTEIAVVDLDLAVDGGNGYPESVGPVLEEGRRYVYDARGTYSIWGRSMWEDGTCKGTPRAHPIFPSPGRDNAETGVDAEFWFAVPVGSSLCEPDFVVPNDTSRVRVSLDGGATFEKRAPVGGVPAGPSVDHAYRYEITGEGAAFHVRRIDTGVGDDYGVLRFTIYRVE